jgi:hypothetical protein
MSQRLVDSLRGLSCIAVNNSFRLAPWALALAANDVKFWNRYPEAMAFAGRKFSTNRIPGTERCANGLINDQTSSAVLATVVAIDFFGAIEIELHGVDNQGGHFHPDHPPPLRNPDEKRFAVFAKQWKEIGKWAKRKGVRIVNMTPNSALTCFERG